MKKRFIWLMTIIFLLSSSLAFAQKQDKTEWITISDDEIATISYQSNITTDSNGNHTVWVKTVFHDREWQNYFSSILGIHTPVVMTKTKSRYDEYYNFVMVRQVIAYSKEGKVLYNSGESSAAGWGPVNASDPVGIVGEYLGDQLKKSMRY